MAENRPQDESTEIEQAEKDVAEATSEDDLEGHSVEEGEGEQDDTITNIGCC